MKFAEFDMKTLLNVLKHQWKFILIVVLVFALIGVGFGVVFADKGAGEAAGEADALPAVEYSKIKMDWDYYASCRDYLVNSYKIADAYRKNFTQKNALTEEQALIFDGIRLQMEEYSENVLNVIERKFAFTGAVYVPEKFLEDYEELCRQGLDSNKHKLEIAQAAAELLAAMDAPTTDTDVTTKSYELIISTAASVLEHMQLVQIYEARLKTLEDRDAVLQAEVQMKQLLTDAAEKFNVIVKSLSEEANAVAKENNVIYNMLPGETDEVEFTLGHTHTASSVEEAFVLIVLFCVLTGICAGLFFAVYRECKRGEKLQSA